MTRFRRLKLDTPEWGVVHLMIALPVDGDPWGVLAPLRGTSWESLLSVVSGANLSHALHGWAVPLMRGIGIDPRRRGSKIPEAESWCALRGECGAAADMCNTGSSKMPSCYEPEGVDYIAVEILLAWQDGWYVLVVDGPEFSF